MLIYFGAQKKLHTLWLSVAVLLELGQAAPVADEGDACKIQSHNGICTAASKCTKLESSMKELGLRRADIVSCGFTVYEELICCPSHISTTTRSNIVVTTFRPLVVGNKELDANSEYYDFSRLTHNSNVGNVDKNELPNRNIWENKPHNDPLNSTQAEAANNGFHKAGRAWQQPKEVLPFSREGVAGSEPASSSNIQLDPFKRFEFRPQDTHINTEPPMARANQMSRRHQISLTNASRDQPFVAEQRRDEIFSNVMFGSQLLGKKEKSVKAFQHQRESKENSARVDIGVERNGQQTIFTFPSESGSNNAKNASINRHELFGFKPESTNFPAVQRSTSNNVNHMRNNEAGPRSWPQAVSSKEADQPGVVSDDVLRQRLDQLFTKDPNEFQQSNHADETLNRHTSNDHYVQNNLDVGQSWPQAVPVKAANKVGVVSDDVFRQRLDQLFTKDPNEFQHSNHAARGVANVNNVDESLNLHSSNDHHVQKNLDVGQSWPQAVPVKATNNVGVVSDDVLRQRLDQLFVKDPNEFQQSNHADESLNRHTSNDHYVQNNLDVGQSWPQAVPVKAANNVGVVSDDVFRQRLDQLFTKDPNEFQQSNHAARGVANVDNVDESLNLHSSNDHHVQKNLDIGQSWPQAVPVKATNNVGVVSDDVLRQRLDQLFVKDPNEFQQSNQPSRGVANINNVDESLNPHSSNDHHVQKNLDIGQSWPQAVPVKVTNNVGVVSNDVLRQRLDQLFTKEPNEFQQSNHADESLDRHSSNDHYVQNNLDIGQSWPQAVPVKAANNVGVVSDDVFRQRLDQFFTKDPIKFQQSTNMGRDRVVLDQVRQRQEEIFRFPQ